MFEIFFITGGLLQITHLHTHTLPKFAPLRIYLLSGVFILGLLLWVLDLLFPSQQLVETICLTLTMFMGLWAIILGLFSMKVAPVWNTWRLLGFHIIVLFLFTQVSIPAFWMIGTLISSILIVLLVIFYKYTLLWLRAFVYAWALIMTGVLEIVYVLPLMQIVSPTPVEAFLTGSLFFSLGTLGFFTVKYLTIFIATSLHPGTPHSTQFRTWLSTHFPSTNTSLQDWVMLLIIVLCFAGSQLLGWYSANIAAMLSLNLLFFQRKEEKGQ